jgi:hypothetical protein
MDRDEDRGFTVSDRRGAGRERSSVSETPSTPVPPRPESAARDEEVDDHRHAGPVDFSGLLLSLASTAMLHLGAPTPDGKTGPVNLPRAQEMIDLLSVLEQKTKGNLTPDESALLGNLLYNLRLRYVEAAR